MGHSVIRLRIAARPVTYFIRCRLRREESRHTAVVFKKNDQSGIRFRNVIIPATPPAAAADSGLVNTGRL